MVRKFFLIVCLGLGSAVADEAKIEPLLSMQKMQQAMRLLNFEGTVAILRNGKLNTLKYFHAAMDGWDQERLVSLNSPLHETVRDAEKVTCFQSGPAKVIVDHRPSMRSFLVDLPENFEGINDFYNLEFSGEEHVAMQPARILDIRPRDQFRYGRKIWIEKQQYLPLKVEVYDGKQNVIEQLVFTEIIPKAVLPVVDVDLAMKGKEIEHIHKNVPVAYDKSFFELTFIPDGFTRQFFSQITKKDTDSPIEHLVLSDGFSSVSVYLEEKNSAMELGGQTNGTINFFSRELGNFLITVLGEVPPITVKKIAEGIKLRSSNS